MTGTGLAGTMMMVFVWYIVKLVMIFDGCEFEFEVVIKIKEWKILMAPISQGF